MFGPLWVVSRETSPDLGKRLSEKRDESVNQPSKDKMLEIYEMRHMA